MPEAARLLPLAESIADGSPVDWESAETDAPAGERESIRELRVLADPVLLHRPLPGGDREPHAAVASTTTPRPGTTAAALDTTAPAIGSWGHLALVERLGGGTAGEVYRAWDRQLECDVALKLLRVKEASDDPHS